MSQCDECNDPVEHLEHLEHQLAEQKRITDSIITVDVAGLRKAWKEAERQLAEAQEKLEAVARWCDKWADDSSDEGEVSIGALVAILRPKEGK